MGGVRGSREREGVEGREEVWEEERGGREGIGERNKSSSRTHVQPPVPHPPSPALRDRGDTGRRGG